MKRFLLILVLGVASFTLSAQSQMSYSLEFVAGVGIGKGPLATFTPEFVASYNMGGFIVGAGVGARYARPNSVYDSKHGRYFQHELDIPVFLRLGYGKAKFFANVDAGYALCVIGRSGIDYEPGEKKYMPYDGLFVEPHVGLKVGRNSAFALGLLLQQSSWHNQTWDSVGEKTVINLHDYKKVFTPAITLRYALSF